MDELSADILREFGNIGTGNAVTALSQMLGIPVVIEVPNVKFTGYREFYSVLAEAEEIQTGIMVEVLGELKGMFLFLLNESFTMTVLDSVLGKETRTLTGLGDMEISLLNELGNIMCGSYIRALSQMMEVEMDVTVPDLCIDMGGAILSVPLSRFIRYSDEVLLIETIFWMEGKSFQGRILFLPEMEALDAILAKFRDL